MPIETIGTDCLDIIYDYKNGMETAEKMKLCFAEIRQISHSYEYHVVRECTDCHRITNEKICAYTLYDNDFSGFEYESIYLVDRKYIYYNMVNNDITYYKCNRATSVSDLLPPVE